MNCAPDMNHPETKAEEKPCSPVSTAILSLTSSSEDDDGVTVLTNNKAGRIPVAPPNSPAVMAKDIREQEDKPRYGLRPRPLGRETAVVERSREQQEKERTELENELIEAKKKEMDTPELIRCKLGLQPFSLDGGGDKNNLLPLSLVSARKQLEVDLEDGELDCLENDEEEASSAFNAFGGAGGFGVNERMLRFGGGGGNYREDSDLLSSNGGGSSRPSFLPFNSSASSASAVELQVTNLDQGINQRDMKRVIAEIFRPHVNVLHVSVFFQSDGNMACCVKVSSLAEAQYAISKLHRTKVGYKRILISTNQPNAGAHPSILKSQVAALLTDVPGGKLQLFNFREMFEKRYHSSIGVSDLYKMREVVTITEEATGRMVTLLPSFSSSGNGNGNNGVHSSFLQQQQQHGQHHYRTPGVGASSSMAGPSALGNNSMSIRGYGGVGLSENNLGNNNNNFPMAASSSNGRMNSGRMAGDGNNGCRVVDAQQAMQLESPFCAKHAPSGRETEGWAERDHGTLLPMVYMGLAEFGEKIKKLIKSHNGTVPLATITHCFTAEFEALPEDPEDGVQLEHLITCVRGVTIQPGITGVKAVVMQEDEPPFSHLSAASGSSHYPGSSGMHPLQAQNAIMPSPYGPSVPASFLTPNQMTTHQPLSPLAKQLAFFSRELVDLLKTQPGCVMLFNKFIPGYHHHFGRQCRAADYGYTKLRDLFKALPHVIQMMGDGSRSKITLAHRAQIKRFTSDLLKVLKSQSSKQITLGDLPQIYEKVHARMFKICDYGVAKMAQSAAAWFKNPTVQP